jgi:hypothetical protein
MTKRLLPLLFFLFTIFCLPLPVHAVTGIDTKLQASYNFSPVAPPKVQLDFTLTNTTPTLFVDHYQVVVPESGVSGLVLQPREQTITQQKTTTDGSYILDLAFDNEVVGQGKARAFGVEYVSADLLRQRGQTQVITIPPLFGSQDFDTYQTTVTVPSSYGPPTVITPEPSQVASSAGQLTYTFDQRSEQVVTIVYGQQQLLQFSLQYTLSNHTSAPTYQEIVFPGDQADLQAIYAHLWPSPVSWAADPDGSWRGYYLLPIGTELTVTADGFFRYHQVQQDFDFAAHFPQVTAQVQIWNLSDLPEEFTYDHLGELPLTITLAQFGIFPRLGTYQISVPNLTGRTWPQLSLSVTDQLDHYQISATPSTFALFPWQKTDIIAKLKLKQWWWPYRRFHLLVQIHDQTGNLIHSQQQSGISISYGAFIALGGLFGLTGTAWSLLVARRKRASALRRQSQKSQKSA